MIGLGIGVTIVSAVKALFVTGAILAVVSVLTWDRIQAWFKQREALYKSDTDNIAFSLVEKIEQGQFKVVYGLFNKRTQHLIEADAVAAESLDQTLLEYHDKEPLVIYPCP
jgi:hypothetical protein